MASPHISKRSCRYPTALAVVALACLLAAGGCQSQTPAQQKQQQTKAAKENAEAEKKKEEEAQRKKPFDVQPVTPLLSESVIETETGNSLRLAKPGHWLTAVQPMKANAADFEGRTTVAPVDDRGRPLPLEYTPFAMTSIRPAVLAKGRPKRLETELFVPATASKLHVSSEVVSSTSGVSVPMPARPPWTLMPSHQYFLLVLAREPGRYAFLKVADAVRAPYEDDEGAGQPHYRVVLADAAKPLPLPPNVLTWTSVAYVVWDEVNVDRIDPSQQRALVDWLHWGGRLIINGPDSIENLRGTFLDKYLPADPGKSRTVSAEDAAKLHAAWTAGRTGPPLAPLALKRPWSAIELKPRPGAVALPGAEELFYERAVGAGSVVVSAMQLAERDLVNWSAFDSFLNGGLLRRPPREFRVQSESGWVGLQMDWADFTARTHDAHFTTPLRWFARDAGAEANVRRVAPTTPNQGFPFASPADVPAFGPDGLPLAETTLEFDRRGGVGQWNEFNPVSNAAREVLREAAGVRVPGVGFVLACLAVYLLVLVPLNWMTFHALGRLEWAWIAAPILALLGAVAVVRQAQLDIGFVRSKTEIALLELYEDHPRGHLSRYSAMYSSLSTVYDMQYDDPTAVATPFPADDERNASLGDNRERVALEKYEKPVLRGLAVSSASTQFVHSEQMRPLDGPIRMTSPTGSAHLKQLENNSGFDLADAVVTRRRFNQQGRATVESCWLGNLASGTTALISWETMPVEKGGLPYAAKRRQADEVAYRPRLNIDPLLKLAFRAPSPQDPLHGRRDEYRLVARIDEPIPGSVPKPAPSQTTGAAVVLAHLQLDLAPPPNPDVNLAKDVAPDRTPGADEDDSFAEPPPDEIEY